MLPKTFSAYWEPRPQSTISPFFFSSLLLNCPFFSSSQSVALHSISKNNHLTFFLYFFNFMNVHDESKPSSFILTIYEPSYLPLLLSTLINYINCSHFSLCLQNKCTSPLIFISLSPSAMRNMVTIWSACFRNGTTPFMQKEICFNSVFHTSLYRSIRYTSGKNGI